MKHLRKFDSVTDMETALASATIDILGLGYDAQGNPVLKTKQGSSPAPDPSIPFYVENITQETEILTIAGYDWSGQDNYLEFPVEYSIDGTNWSLLGTTGATPLTRTLQPGDKVYLRATANTWYEYQEEPDYIEHGCAIFGVSKVGGNIMSLLYGSNFSGNETTFPTGSSYNFRYLFIELNNEQYNRNLISASELILPATTLAEGCYSAMFIRCTSLTTAPELPATTLAGHCYYDMFDECTSLTTAPELPATTLAQNCYNNMFWGCTSLTTAPSILPATTLAQCCYQYMFQGCTSLTTAPELPATTLAESCYSIMFMGCTNLNYIKCLATDVSIPGCTEGWLNRVASTGTFVKNPSMTSWTTGASGIPSGWTVQDATE